MLNGQSHYGSKRALADAGPIAFGRNLHPMLPEDAFDQTPLSRGAFQFLADVRLDNRPELIAQLDQSQPQAARMADSALLFEALLKWGEAAVDRLVGEFAFALWDGNKQELLLGRDILGLRPLHYYRGNGFFAFASMPCGLHALDDVPYDVDMDFMVERLALIPPAGPKTYFKGINRVESGHIVHVSATDFRSATYWNPAGPGTTRLSDADYEEGLRSVLDQAVSSHLRGVGDVVASQLSGGLDSSIVTATAARRFDGKVIAFTAAPRAGFDAPAPGGALADESHLATATTQLYPNIEHVIIRNSGESPVEWLDRHFRYYQRPMPNVANAVWGQAIHRAARDRGANTILKGGMGNLTLSYSGIEWLPFLLSKGRVIEVVKQAAGLARKGMPLIPLAAHILGPFTPAPIWNAVRKAIRKNSGMMDFSAANRKHLDQIERTSSERKWDLALRPQRDPWDIRVNEIRSADGGNAYKGVLGEWGLSVRDPMSDRRVIEFNLAVPYDQFLRGGVSRSLARRAFGDRLPNEVANSSRRGYQAADWYESLDRAKPAIEAEIESIMRCDDAGEAVDFEWLQECLSSWPEGEWQRDDVLRKYRLGLLRGVAAGHFIRKVKGTN